jgi:HK97 family phage major capsid protein
VSKFKDIMGQIEETNNKVCAIFDKADAENNGELTKEQWSEVEKFNKEIEQLELKATDLKEGEAARLAAEERKKQLAASNRLPIPGQEREKGDGSHRPSPGYAAARKSMGRALTESPEFKKWFDELFPTGHVSERKRIQSPIIRVEGKALITGLSDTSAGAGVRIDYQDIIVPAPFKPLTLLDLVTQGETTSDTVEYVRITGYQNNAAPVAEATATDDGSGEKPESGMSLEKVIETVRTIAHWIPATNRSLADFAQIRTLIDAFLIFGLKDIAESLMLTGDGTGENFLGIYNTPGIQTQAYVNTGEPLLTTTRKARTKAKTPGRVIPNAYLFNPLDWETFDLLQDGEERYRFGGPSVLGTPRLWGIPVVENENNPTGRGLLGDFRWAIFWDRMQAMISASNSHADFFIRNLVAILAEMRAAFGVLYPKAFVDIDLTA